MAEAEIRKVIQHVEGITMWNLKAYQRVLCSVAVKCRKLEARSSRKQPYQIISFDTRASNRI